MIMKKVLLHVHRVNKVDQIMTLGECKKFFLITFRVTLGYCVKLVSKVVGNSKRPSKCF